MTEQGLLSALQAVKYQSAQDNNVCGVARFLRTLDDKEKAEYEEILDNANINSARLSKVFFDNGHRISSYMIRYHRNRLEGRGCKCPIIK
jgi:hypothetical protein